MPVVDGYIAEVTVSVTLRSTGAGVVAEYAVTRKAKCSSMKVDEVIENSSGAVSGIEAATVDALAASRAMAAGVQNAERRRLK